MSNGLYQCTSEDDQTDRTVAHLKASGAISDVLIWLESTGRCIFAESKSNLQAEGLTVTSIMKNLAEAAGQTQNILT